MLFDDANDVPQLLEEELEETTQLTHHINILQMIILPLGNLDHTF